LRVYRAEAEGEQADPEALGDRVGRALIDQGADQLLAELIKRLG